MRISVLLLCSYLLLGCEETSITGDPPTVEDAEVPDADVDAGDGGFLPAAKLGLSDLSILFPLPSDPESDALLALDAPALDGPLLTRAQFDAIPVFAHNPGEELAYERFRVVGMRVDPCFPDLALLESNPARCRKQLRLVAQPLAREEGTASALDSAIHLLYDLEDAAFRAVLGRLVALRGERAVDRDEVLGVNPVLAEQGEDGTMLAALRALVLEHVGPAQLQRFTFMRGDENFSWRFGGLDVDGAALTAVAIHGIEADDETSGFDQSIAANGGLMNIAPATEKSETLAALFGDLDCGPDPAPGCATLALKRSPMEIEAALEMALRVEDPRRENAESVDCGSCHQAGPLRARAEALGHSSEGLPRFDARWNLALSNTAELTGAPNRVRAFGYFRKSPVLAQRVVNETAQVADAVNALLE